MWILSTLRDKRVIQARARWTRQQVLDYQERMFREMLRHVWDSSPFYRDYYANHGIGETDLAEIALRDIPIVSKELLMENFDRISRDPALRRDRLEAWIHSGSDELVYDKRFVVIHTSGTSGTFGLFVYDKKAWTRMRGVTTRSGHIRVNPFRRAKLAWYGAIHGRFAGVTACRTLPRIVCNQMACSVLDPLAKTVATLNAFQPEYLFGYSAAIHELAEAALGGTLAIRPRFVGTSGEILTGEAAAAIERAWGIRPTNAYGTSESLCLGLRTSTDDALSLMEDETIIEMLDGSDREVAPGKVGRVVITSLYNRAIPIVRYDMRDYVTRGHRQEHEAFDKILRVEGRVEDALPVTLSDGMVDKIHPVVLSEFFVPGIQRFQFIGESPAKIALHYLAESDIDASVREAFERILAMKGALGSTELHVERVAGLAADPATGKRRLVLLKRRIHRDARRPLHA